jgi:DNA repair ATPase RecN
LRVIILLKHLDHRNAIREDEVIARRMEELDKEHVKTQEYQELDGEYSKLFKTIQNTEDKEQRNKALFELDRLTVDMMAGAAKFYYLAGVHDVMQVYDFS